MSTATTVSTPSPSGTFRKVHPLDAHAAIRLGLPAPDHLSVIRSVAMASILVAPAFEAEVKAVLTSRLAAACASSRPANGWRCRARRCRRGWSPGSRSRWPAWQRSSTSRMRACFSISRARPCAPFSPRASGVDLRPDAFPVGRSANVLLGHIAANLAADRNRPIRDRGDAQLCGVDARRSAVDGPRIRAFRGLFGLTAVCVMA